MMMFHVFENDEYDEYEELEKLIDKKLREELGEEDYDKLDFLYDCEDIWECEDLVRRANAIRLAEYRKAMDEPDPDPYKIPREVYAEFEERERELRRERREESYLNAVDFLIDCERDIAWCEAQVG